MYPPTSTPHPLRLVNMIFAALTAVVIFSLLQAVFLNDPLLVVNASHPQDGNVVIVRIDLSTRTPTPTPTQTASLTPSLTLTPTRTLTPSLTFTPTQTFTATRTFTTTRTFTPTQTFTSTRTFTPTNTLTPTATRTVVYQSTEVGSSVISRRSPIDGMLQLFIPAGDFKMGSYSKWDVDYKPRHTVHLDAFWISQTQVTNALYALCEAAGACTTPIRKEINPHYYDPQYANHPVVYITWYQAGMYCAWTGGWLPTEAQWEKAAGAGTNHYPWRSGSTKGRANVNNQHTGTVPVGSYPLGASPFGVLDMGSNVREWVSDWYDPRYYSISPFTNPLGPTNGDRKTLRGASWHDPVDFSAVTHRVAHAPNSPGNNRGFRCTYSN